MTNDQDSNSLTLPRGWVWSQLAAVSDIILGQSPPSSTYNDEGIGLPFYQGKLEFGEIYPTPRKWCTAPKKTAEKGDVLISLRAPVGPTNVCPEKSCIGRGLAAIRGLGGVESLFILYLMRMLENVIAGKGTGTTFNAISGDQLRSLRIPLPPLPEQRRIAAKIEELFTNLDAGRASLLKVKMQLKRYRQAITKYAFEGKLTEKWRETHKDQTESAQKLLQRIERDRRDETKGIHKELPPVGASELPKLPDDWTWTLVGYVSELIQYGTSEKARVNPKGIPVLRMGNIQDGKLVFEDLKYLPLEYSRLQDFLLEDGDVLFNRTNSAELVGKTAVYKQHHPKALFASYLIRIRTNKNSYLPSILSYFINSIYGRTYIASVVSQQVGQANVNGTKLSLMPVPLIPFKEQQRINEEIEHSFSVADATESATETSLKQSERLGKSILRMAFNGRLVPQDPSDEPAEKLLERIMKEKTTHEIDNDNGIDLKEEN